MHDLESLIGVLFANTDEHQVVENTFWRQRHVHDFRKIHAKDRQKDPNGRVAHVKIFHRWRTDNRCWIKRIPPVSDGGYVEYRIFFNRRIETGVIAEGAFGPAFARLNKTFEDEIHVGRHF